MNRPDLPRLTSRRPPTRDVGSPSRRRGGGVPALPAVAVLTVGCALLSGASPPADAHAGSTRSGVVRVGGDGGVAGDGGVGGEGGATGKGGDARQPAATYRWPLEPPVHVTAPFEAPPAPWAAGHRGVDLRAPGGTVVRAPSAGTVTFVGVVAGRGVVTVTHGDGLRSSVEPVTAAVDAGTQVDAGDALGTVTPDGGHCAATGCLHWGVRRGEVYVDPVALVEGGPIVLLPTR